jgi:hypothetical protein
LRSCGEARIIVGLGPDHLYLGTNVDNVRDRIAKARSASLSESALLDFDSLDALAERLLRFGQHYRQIARPFEWTFTRADLDRLLAKIITQPESQPALAA